MAKKKKAKKIAKKPQDNGDLGRNKKGRFVNGNSIGKEPGKHPNTRKLQKLKDAIIATVTEKDIQDIVKKLVVKAKAGNIQAVKELFDRLFGKPKETVDQNVSLLGVIKNIPSTQEAYGEMQDYMKSKDGIDRKSINGNGNGDKKNS